MNKLLKYLSIILFAMCTLCGCGVINNANSVNSEAQYVIVSVEPQPHISIKSTNPLKLKKGEDAIFKIDIDKGYHFGEHDSEGTYSDGVYCVPNIQYSRTLKFKIKKNGEFTITIHNDDSKGKVQISPNEENFAMGDEISLICEEKEDNKFISYSFNAYSHSDSTWTKVGVPFSYSKNTKLIVDDDLDIYVNYYDKSNYLITYDGNGGTTLDGESKIVADFKMPNYQYSPNSIQGSRYFFRDGYVLTSWNTKSDGSGTRIGLGSKIPTDCCDGLTAKLYATWEKETDLNCFSFVENEDDTLSISSYNESLNTGTSLIIPRKKGNLIIRRIEANAIQTNKARVVIADTILSIGDNGIISDTCSEFVFFTSLEDISGKSINCPSVSKMYVNALTYTSNHESNVRDLTRKYDYIEHMDKSKKKFLMIGHSTLFHNHDVAPLANKYTEYNVYKLGVTFGFPSDALIDLAGTLLESKDRVLYQFHEGASAVLGPGYDFLAYMDCNFDLYTKLNFTKYVKRFFKDYMKWRGLYTDDIKVTIYGYETPADIDKYGNTVQMTQDDYAVTNENRGTSTIEILSEYRKQGCYEHILRTFKELPTQNICIEWTSYNNNAINSMNTLYEFESIIKQDFSSYTFISSIADNCLSGEYFRKNDNSHLTVAGGALRVARWVDALSEFLA